MARLLWSPSLHTSPEITLPNCLFVGRPGGTGSPSEEELELEMLWLWLLWLHGCLAVSYKAKRCFLYPVQKDEWSPDFFLNERANTGITINNINFKHTGVSKVTLDKQCIALLSYNGARRSDRDQCPIFSVADEYVHLFIRRLEEGVGVRLGGSQTTDEVEVHVDIAGEPTLSVTTSYYMNVAYDCPLGECFQFEDATIHQSFEDTEQGSLTFKGKVIRAEGDRGYIEILGAPEGVPKDNRRVSLKDVTSPDWHSFTLFMIFKEEYQRSDNYNAYISIHDKLSPMPLFAAEKLVFQSPELYLRFRTARNMNWAICQTSAPSLASISTSITQHPCKLPNNSTGYPESLQERETQLLVFGAVCGLILLLLAFLFTAFVLRLRKRPTLGDVQVPFRNTTSATTPTQSADIDLKQVQVSGDQSQTVSQQDRRKSHESINSIYDWMNTDPINVSK